MTVANQYQKLLQLARSSNTFPGTRVAPYTQSSNAVQTSSSSSSTAMMNTTTVATAGATAAQSSSSAAASVNNGVSSNGSGPQMIRSSKNSPIHPLAYALASVAPSKHCVRVRVTGIWPTTALELVTNTNINTAENGNSQSVPGNAIENSSSPNTTYTPHWVFMFALRVQDETATADVILYDKEAEYFLGVSATEYVNNEEVREGVFNRLQLLMTTNTNSTIILELFLQSYHSIEKRTQRSVKRLAVLETALSDAQI